MPNPTLHDVARAAGVSYSTADRVLNRRGGVAEKSILRVQRAIEELGYQRDIHAANLSRRRSYDFRFYLPFGDHGFFSVLRRAVEGQIQQRLAERVQITVHDVPPLDADALAAELSRIGAGECDCVGIIGSDSAALTLAVERLEGIGIPVVTLVSDAAIDARSLYVGIDNVAAGRTAGRLLRFAHGRGSGRVLPILGKLDSRDHRDRLSGAREVLAEPGGDLHLLSPLEVLDRPEAMREKLAAALASDPQITGIYSIGAGNRALIQILRQITGPRPFVVLHELTAHSRAALEADLIDAVIDQKPDQEIALAIQAMKTIADQLPVVHPEVNPTIFLRDNLPA
ncbi:LacI family DNA-binding transcriptional regulator [Paracoccus sp. CPCC 101403]|uniref:LacI family DNA-binding transcriptional regulator n=2 Tax=Paracoccus broussonetiae TaxID=3075834 RepID=A0ABU3EKV6_9RHOB|nr:LacI family DNA-binding transcriptional regulator [Paracoccus sp. CPCC 101403]MDT1064070.1 LacI family DNA-binding transcriptional regulator [Paracoccus sp. CPCC 101403]